MIPTIQPGYQGSPAVLRPREMQGYHRQRVLTAEQKAQGRAFRDECMAGLAVENAEHPPTYSPISLQALFRHLCPAHGHRSEALELKEVYVVSVDGVWAFIYREGECRGCHQTARTKVGRIVLAQDRPPTAGRKARGSASTRASTAGVTTQGE